MTMPARIYRRHGKRLFDVIATLLLAPCLLPIMAIVALLVWMNLGRPILYRQVRAGKHKKLFVLYKFRTMAELRNEHSQLAPDELRLTRLGKFLRASSLDELPGLWNVLRGDMSLVGPRPLLTEYLTLYSPEQARRHEVKPGITGWAQVNGRNAITWDEKFAFDVRYSQRVGFWLDIKILMQTVLKVVKREDISAKDFATMPKFCGSNGSLSTGGPEQASHLSDEQKKAA